MRERISFRRFPTPRTTFPSLWEKKGGESSLTTSQLVASREKVERFPRTDDERQSAHEQDLFWVEMGGQLSFSRFEIEIIEWERDTHVAESDEGSIEEHDDSEDHEQRSKRRQPNLLFSHDRQFCSCLERRWDRM